MGLAGPERHRPSPPVARKRRRDLWRRRTPGRDRLGRRPVLLVFHREPRAAGRWRGPLHRRQPAAPAGGLAGLCAPAGHVDARPQPAIPVVLSPAGRRGPGAGTVRCCWATPSIPTCPTWGKAPARPSRTRMCWASCWRKGWRISPADPLSVRAGARTAMLGRDSVRLGRFAQAGGPHRAACATWRCAACPIGCTRGGTRQQFGIAKRASLDHAVRDVRITKPDIDPPWRTALNRAP